MNQLILVLGANGFIGRHVLSGLAAGDSRPIAGVRRHSSRKDGCEERVVDATDAASVTAAMRGVSAVVNCVAGYERTLVASADSAAQAARSMEPSPRIIHLSTMSVYGSAEGLIPESAPLRGDLGAYSQAKVEAEARAGAYPRTVILRPGCVFGPESEQWTIRMARLLISRRLGDLGPAGDGICNLVDVSDVVQAVVRALDDPRTDGRAFNLATPEAPTWNEFLTRFGVALRAVPVRRISGRRLRLETKLWAPPLKIGEILFRRLKLDARRLPPPIPPSLLRLMAQEIRLDSRAATDELGVRWKPLQRSLEEAAEWYTRQLGGERKAASGSGS
jgi:nucleoside-diphosphate-sugar epimerase